MTRALIVIDIQNDYFAGGRYPQWNTEATLAQAVIAIKKANSLALPVVLIQHVASEPAPFFNSGSVGVELHKDIVEAAPNAPIVIKQHADSFLNTNLTKVLSDLSVSELLLCGMMTQNCITHTGLSRLAADYKVTVLADCCTSVDEMVNGIALKALSDQVVVVPAAHALT